MKKRLPSILILIVSVLVVLPAANTQTVYTVRDSVYKRVEQLCMRSGVIGPTTSSPMPAQALIIALERINPNTLSVVEKEEYDELMSILNGEDPYLFEDGGFAFNLDTLVNLAVNIADYSKFDYGNKDSDAPDYDRREDTLIPYRYEDPIFRLGFDMDFGDHVALEARVDIKSNHLRLYETNLGGIYTGSGIAAEWPYRAGGSFGNEYVNLILGRYPHSVGSGITGNLLIGDNFNYQEVLLLSFMSNHFTYNISMTRFDMLGEPDKTGYVDFTRHEFQGKQQFRVNHRFDVTLFDKVRFALNLTTIYSSTSAFDWRFFYPFVLGHNYYNYNNSTSLDEIDEANNLMTIEAEWMITKDFTLSGQLAIDQFQMPWEEFSELPLAFGALVNLKYSTLVGEGRFTSWFEAVYTNPYLYLNGKYDDEGNHHHGYELDYVVGYNMIYMDDYGFSGYIYGPDSIVFSIGAGYTSLDERSEITGSLLYRIKGDKNIKHRADSNQNTDIDMGSGLIEQNSDEFMKNIWTPSGGWDHAEHLIKPAIQGTHHFIDGQWGRVSATVAIGANIYFNYDHQQGNKEFMPQMMFSIAWAY